MGPIQVVVQDGNNLVLEVTPTPSTTVILDRGIAGPPGPTGTGDVDGPASSTDNAVARFDGTTGKLIQNSVVTIGDTGNMAGVGTLAVTDLTDSSLTAGRVTYAGTGGNLVDSANMTFNGTRLTVADLADSGLTSGRVTYAAVGGALVDSANLTFNGTDLTVSGAVNAGSINATTLDLTNLEVTNIKAKDGTASITLADSTGVASFSANPVISAGTANGVAYLNGSKVLTTGSALTFDGTNLGVGIAAPGTVLNVVGATGIRVRGANSSSDGALDLRANNTSCTINAATFGAPVPLVFAIDGSEQMRLTSTGLGIGTSSPGAKLTVRTSDTYGLLVNTNNVSSGTTRLSLGGYLDAAGGSGGTAAIGAIHNHSATSESSLAFYTYGGGALNQVAVLSASGNLGLGVTPSAQGATYRAINLSSSASYFSIAGQGAAACEGNLLWNARTTGNETFAYMNTGDLATRFRQSGQFSWHIAPSGTAGNAISFTQAMSLTAGGNLLVGLTAPTSAERFSVWRDNVTTNSLVANIQNQAATSTSRNSNTLLRISSNASGADAAIQLTDNTANNYWFGGNNGGAYVVANSNGVRLANGGTSWASDSDERVKDIIEPITDAVNKVSTLRSVIGKYKTDANGTRRSFLIAQDVQAVLPEAVFDEKGTLMLAYTDTIPLLVAAIQELKAEFDAYKASHP
jgi:hypothetical protein